MLPRSVLMLLAMITLAAGPIVAQEKPHDPIGDRLFPPDMVLHFQDKIDLSDEQREVIQGAVEELQAEMKEQQAAMQAATTAAAEEIEQETIDEAEALERLSRVLELEQQLKRMHVRMLIRVRNELTAEQREQLTDLKPAADEIRAAHHRLEEKIERVKAAVQERAEAGNPPTEIVEMMQKFPELMKAGKVREAEMLVDEALEQLGE